MDDEKFNDLCGVQKNNFLQGEGAEKFVGGRPKVYH
jgi:hypothetical protein